jgi:Ca2+-binding EF-hand superfamily protein
LKEGFKEPVNGAGIALNNAHPDEEVTTMSERMRQNSGSAAARGHEVRLRGSFDTEDLNRDGRLTLGEFMRFMSSTDPQMSAEECQIAFDEIDTDHDGLVDFAQLLVWWNERLIPPDPAEG